MFATLAIGLAACGNDDENKVNNGPVEAQINAGVSGPLSRAMNDTWEADAIGVIAKSVEGTTEGVESQMANLYKNVKYTTTATTNIAANFSAEIGKGIFFQDAKEIVTFAAYAPYQTSSANNVLPGTSADGIITGSTEAQSSRDSQKAFDYIYASGATASRQDCKVEFKESNAFVHKMTRLVIIVKTSADFGFTAAQVTGGTYKLSGLNHSGQFDVTKGEAKATGTTTTSDWSLTDKSLKTTGETTQCTFTSILYPQTLGAALTFTAEIGGQTYTNSTDINPELSAGQSYEYTITAKKTGLTVSGCTIKAWNPNTNVGGDATM